MSNAGQVFQEVVNKMEHFNISEQIKKAAAQAEELCQQSFKRIDKITEYNQQKVLAAFIENNVGTRHFAETTGYGYGDDGRDLLDKVFAQCVVAEDALVRHSFASGTHCLTVALFGLLRPNDTLLCVTGKPYDTLEEVIGISGEGMGSLKDFGVKYEQIDLLENGEPDIEAIKNRVSQGNVKLVYIQRSRGYSLRKSLTVSDIAKISVSVKANNPDAIIMVDNCYGEFVEKSEPCSVGADIIAGSLIKNAGGSLALSGGYIAGRADLVELCSYRMTNPGTGREVGASLNQNRNMFMGLFNAPHVTGEAMKTAVFAAALFEILGFGVTPRYDEERSDIIQAIKLLNEENLCAFCQGIQSGSPVDAFVTPEPWDMPGYNCKVIMAAGGFVSGASIELSADAPIREPFAAWMQGGINYHSAKVSVMLAAQKVMGQ